MIKIPRVVLDTNVFVSGFIFQKSLYKIVKAWHEVQFVWVLSPEIVKEYLAVISRPKFKQSNEKINAISTVMNYMILDGSIEQVIPKIKINIIKEDPGDNIFLECAVEGKADYIVSGDRHLLNLKSYKDIYIFTPSEFLQTI